jgi:hypothetical protein
MLGGFFLEQSTPGIKSAARKIKTPPLAGKRNGGAGTEKRPKPSILMIPTFSVL